MSELAMRQVAIVGGGPAGLMAAEMISRASDVRVTVFEAMPSAGRKLLMAGRGGLNLTHSEPMAAFLARYGARADVLGPLIEAWSPSDVRAWCEELGEATFTGSSGRVFPKVMKASGLLRVWLRRLAAQGVALRTRHRWMGMDREGRLLFATPDGAVTVAADATVLALGGGSWPRLGSDGSWVAVLEGAGVEVAALVPANMGLRVAWSDVFRARFEGQPLKRVTVTHGGSRARGEAVVTATGIEGGAIYAVSAAVRDALMRTGEAVLEIDLRPDVALAALAEMVARPRGKQSMASHLRKTAGLSPVAIGLMQERAFAAGGRLAAMTPDALAAAIKAVALPVTGVQPIEKAISSAGGVRFEAVDERLMLKAWPGVFVAGEMLDWEAPTGGYLLQACLATGAAAGHGVAAWLGAD